MAGWLAASACGWASDGLRALVIQQTAWWPLPGFGHPDLAVDHMRLAVSTSPRQNLRPCMRGGTVRRVGAVSDNTVDD